ncbi:sensor histidine kinase [Sphingomonas sp.]|uniref:sensor histidine kinase n=1 Tax=Sphingomonas sp. TaxID=28214 RepID=UPI0025FEB091|nr:sensor histidine kinase [Sphingomonas sp.]
MRLLPRSIRGRLLALSAIATLIALIVAGVAIGSILERFVVHGADQRLDNEGFVLASLVTRDGAIDRTRAAEIEAGFAPGDVWRIDTPSGSLSRGGLGPLTKAMLDRLPPPHLRPDRRHDRDASPWRPFDSDLIDGEPVHGRWRTVLTDAGPATVAVATPRETITRPILGAMAPLILSLLALGVLLAIATLIQLRLGLRPLDRLRDDIAAVRNGRAERLPEDQPAELAPLAGELNALVADNQAALAAARGSAANLAHGLKTPIATLALVVGEAGRDPDGRLAALVARLDATVRHHLGRARASIASERVVTPVIAVAEGLATALRRIHAERGVVIDVAVPPELTVAVDRTDLDEMIGNLADNAMRWARSRVVIGARAASGSAIVTIEDDGPGIPAVERDRALAKGARLDERGEGHGFGLAIAHELAILYGGDLTLGDAPDGGLTATLTLPLAR